MSKLLEPYEKFYLWRQRKGYNQYEASRIYGISEKRLRQWERGERPEEIPNFDIGEITLAEVCIIGRRRAGLTQQQIADRIGVTELTIRNWEKGLGYVDRYAFHLSLISLLPI